MKILESIWDSLTRNFQIIIDAIKSLIDGIKYIINFIDRFDNTLNEVEVLTSQIFPTFIVNAFLGVLGFYIGIRVIRFLTLQG